MAVCNKCKIPWRCRTSAQNLVAWTNPPRRAPSLGYKQPIISLDNKHLSCNLLIIVQKFFGFSSAFSSWSWFYKKKKKKLSKMINNYCKYFSMIHFSAIWRSIFRGIVCIYCTADKREMTGNEGEWHATKFHSWTPTWLHCWLQGTAAHPHISIFKSIMSFKL